MREHAGRAALGPHRWVPTLAVAFLALVAAAGLVRAAQPDAGDAEIHVLPVQGNVYMLVSAGANVTVQIGDDGVVLVDTQVGPLVPKILAAVRTLSDKPIHTIINTHLHADHTGGNMALQKLGAGGGQARIIAHENVLRRMMSAPDHVPNSQAGLPLSGYFTPTRDIHVNGEAIVLHHVPDAHTDGDSLVFFRGSDVVSAGDVFTPETYPIVDLDNGGSVQGVVNALNRILDLTVPARFQEGGTYVIPGHGRLCDEADVVEYRDMVVIVRDRVQDLIDRGMTLEQVQDARPSRDYDTEYGGEPDRFVEAVYWSLSQGDRAGGGAPAP